MSKESAIMEIKILLICFSALVCASFVTSEKLVVCYYGSWATDRPGLGQLTVDDINVDLCTHILYAFAGIDWNGFLISREPGLDLPYGRNNFAKFTALKQKKPNLKTILAVGGWDEGSAKYSNMASNPWLRSNFISSALIMIQQYGFDGLDLFWEYPNRRDSTHREADINNFSTLIREIRAEFDKHGLSVSAAVSATEEHAKLSYDVPTISQYLDWVSIMSYDMYGSWDLVTGHSAPLHKGLGDEGADPKTLNTVDNAVEYWLNAGCPPEKLVLGLTSTGRTFRLADASQHNVRAPNLGAGIAGPFTTQPGLVGYNEICNIIQTESWTVEFDHLAKVPYTYKDSNWVSFDNAESIAKKVKFGLEYNVTGFMIWSIETDDFRGTCGEANVLLKSVNRALESKNESSTWPNESTTWIDENYASTIENETVTDESSAWPSESTTWIDENYASTIENETVTDESSAWPSESTTWTDENYASTIENEIDTDESSTWPDESTTSSPENSTEPSNSTQPSNPTQPPVSTHPSNSTTPPISTHPSNSTQPPISTQPSNFTQPSNSTEPPISTHPSNSTQPSNSTEPPISTHPSNSTQPPISTHPSNSTQPPISTHPSNSTQPSNSTEPPISTHPSNSTQPPISTHPSNSTQPPISTQPSNCTWPSTAESTSTTENPTKPPVGGSVSANISLHIKGIGQRVKGIFSFLLST